MPASNLRVRRREGRRRGRAPAGRLLVGHGRSGRDPPVVAMAVVRIRDSKHRLRYRPGYSARISSPESAQQPHAHPPDVVKLPADPSRLHHRWVFGRCVGYFQPVRSTRSSPDGAVPRCRARNPFPHLSAPLGAPDPADGRRAILPSAATCLRTVSRDIPVPEAMSPWLLRLPTAYHFCNSHSEHLFVRHHLPSVRSVAMAADKAPKGGLMTLV